MPAPSPDNVAFIDLTEDDDDDEKEQERRLGDIRRFFAPTSGRKRNKQQQQQQRGSWKTTGLDDEDEYGGDGKNAVIDLLDSDGDVDAAKDVTPSPALKKTKVDGDTGIALVKQEGATTIAAAKSTSIIVDEDLQVVEPTSPKMVAAAAAPSTMLNDDDVVLQGVANELRLPHLRQDCTSHNFEPVPIVNLMMRGECPKRFAAKNKLSCDLCYCFVCDCPAKDCQKWYADASVSPHTNHCCAINNVPLWQRLQEQRKIKPSSSAGDANTDHPPSGFHFSSACNMEGCRNCWCYVCDVEFLPCCGDRRAHLSAISFHPPSRLLRQQWTAMRKLSTWGRTGPFPPDCADAPKDTGLKQCRHCSWFSRPPLSREGNNKSSASPDDWCLCCGRVACQEYLSKDQNDAEADLKDMYLFGEREIPFRIHAHDPRLFDDYKAKWAEHPEWQYDETDRDDEVFLHIMGTAPKLRNVSKWIQLSSADKIPKSGGARTQTDAILIDDPNHVNLISLLDTNIPRQSTAVSPRQSTAVSATWNRQLRSGVLKIQLLFPKSFFLGNNRDKSYSELQQLLPAILAVWFGCTFDTWDLTCGLKPSPYTFLRYHSDISFPFDSGPVNVESMIPAAKQLLQSQTEELTAARTRHENALSLSPSDGNVGGVCTSEISFKSCLLRYFHEYFPTLVSRSPYQPPRNLIGICSGLTRRDDSLALEWNQELLHSNKILDSILGFTNACIAQAVFQDCSKTVQAMTTTTKIMGCLENLGHAAEPFVEGLKVELLDFQKQALKWAVEREQMTGGVQSFYWAKLPDREGRQEDLYFHPIIKQFRKDKPQLARGGILAAEMGLGKTIISLGLILKNPAPEQPSSGSPVSSISTAPQNGWDKSLYKRTSKENERRGSIVSRGTLVICPVSLVGQWIEEAKSRLKTPGLVYPYHGPSRNRDAQELAKAAIVVTTYQVLASDDSYHRVKGGNEYCAPLEQVRWWRIIADEGHSLREGATQRSRACQALVADNKWIVSGTPMSTDPKEMKNLLKFIGIEESEKMFASITTPGRNRPLTLVEPNPWIFMLRPILLRHSQKQTYRGTGTTLMALPPMSKRTIEVTFSNAEKEAFDKLEQSAKDFYLDFRRLHMETMSKHFLKVSAKLMPLRVASSGGKYPIGETTTEATGVSNENKNDEDNSEDDDDEGGVGKKKKKRPIRQVQYSDFTFTSKANVLIKELKKIRDKEPKSKSLIFSHFASTLEHLQQLLPQNGFSFRTLKGDMSMKQRATALHDFQNDPPTTVFLLSLRAGAVGINLTQANRVFLMEPGFNPALESQAIGRVHRLGQVRAVEICRLVMKDSFESRMVKFLQKKYSLSFDESSEININNASDDDDEDEAGNKKKNVVRSATAFQPMVGNLQTERAQVMTEEFDELFGVQDRVANAERLNDYLKQWQSDDDSDDDSVFPDATTSRFI